jgi:hypothetical protein
MKILMKKHENMEWRLTGQQAGRWQARPGGAVARKARVDGQAGSAARHASTRWRWWAVASRGVVGGGARCRWRRGTAQVARFGCEWAGRERE